MSTIPSDDPRPPTAFISYAQTTPGWTGAEKQAWMENILLLATVLSGMGIDVDVDQFHFEEPGVDWNRFGTMAVEDSDFVILAVSPAYRDRLEGRNDEAVGAGAVREADAILGIMNRSQEEFRRKVVVVVLPGAELADVPTQLSGHQRYVIDDVTQDGVEGLFRLLSAQPATPKPPVAPLLRMPAGGEMRGAEDNERELQHLYQSLHRLEVGLSSVDEFELGQARLGQRALPGQRAAAQLDAEYQRVIARIAVLEDQSGNPIDETVGIDAHRVLEAIRAADRDSPGDDIKYTDVAARLRCLPNDPDFQRHLARAETTGLIEAAASVDQLPGPIVFRLAT